MSKAVASRVIEFGRGRSCARRAMIALGFAPKPVLSDAQRAPIWPEGLVGSISHCREYCCAVVGRSDQWAAVGVDAEVLQPLTDGLPEQILSEAERRSLASLDPSIPWSCVVFSIKEAIYKAWYPLTRSWLDFHDVVVQLEPELGRFEAEILRAAPASCVQALRRVEGRFCLDGGHALATVAIARESVAA